jgi:hypothetical protein
MNKKIDEMLENALKQSYMDGYKKGFVDGYNESSAEQLEQPQPKQSGTISITMPVPIGYLCENATGHKYFRWKKPPSTYKPIALYAAPPKEKNT